jgi:CDP-glucose 4,6-dehydratase
VLPFDDVYRGRSVLVTGHTGFKGSWLTTWLCQLGARVTGYALDPPTRPNLFTLLGRRPAVKDRRGDIRDGVRLRRVLKAVKPDFIFHLAAQPIVRRSYDVPLETISVNTLGTATLLDAVRQAERPCVVVVVTSDKCYENEERASGYREGDALGGHDPYSASKAAAELVVQSWRRSFFPAAGDQNPGIRVASARAGNVIGGGDWSVDRLVPDCIRALTTRGVIRVRNPRSARPWQHVLEPLSGYLWLGARMVSERGEAFPDAWNFGPAEEDSHSVAEVVDGIITQWGTGRWEHVEEGSAPHEARGLVLSCDKARAQGWRPAWTFDVALARTVAWYRAWADGEKDIRGLCRQQISEYTTRASLLGISWAGEPHVASRRREPALAASGRGAKWRRLTGVAATIDFSAACLMELIPIF